MSAAVQTHYGIVPGRWAVTAAATDPVELCGDSWSFRRPFLDQTWESLAVWFESVKLLNSFKRWLKLLGSLNNGIQWRPNGGLLRHFQLRPGPSAHPGDGSWRASARAFGSRGAIGGRCYTVPPKIRPRLGLVVDWTWVLYTQQRFLVKACQGNGSRGQLQERPVLNS